MAKAFVDKDGFEYNCQHPIVAIRKHFGFSLRASDAIRARGSK